jgi:uncharacterized repeat protein (TIGR01451 family)
MKHLFLFFIGVLSLGLFAGALPVSAASSAISIGSVSPTSATTNMPVTLSTNVQSTAGAISSCSLYVDNDDKGAMTLSGGAATKSYTFVNSQVYTVFVFCRDAAGNFNSGPNTAVWATGGSSGSGDINPPVMGSVSPSSATVGEPVTFTINVSDSGGVASCDLFVSGQDAGAMTLASGTASKSHTFTQDGSFAVYAQCRDLADNAGTSANTAVSVLKQVVDGPTQGSLIKLACPVGALSDHPCKAVYYYGTDGKRHAFPSDKVFFTWYADFNAVQTVTSDEMAHLPLGKNVTYRPGSRMV